MQPSRKASIAVFGLAIALAALSSAVGASSPFRNGAFCLLPPAMSAFEAAVAAQTPAQSPSPSPSPAARGDQPPQGGGDVQQPTFRGGVNLVRVDVIVSDKQGAPVADLRQEDFEILEDNKAQKVDQFKLVQLTGSPAPGSEPARQIRSTFDQEREAAREDVRIFVFFLDDYHVRRGSAMRVREVLANFIRNQLGPLDLVAVLYPLSPIADLTLTRNHESVIGAIGRFDGRKYDYQPRNEFEEKYAYYPASTVEVIRNQVSMSALRGLAIRLGGLREGRKSVILVSEGYTNILPPQMRDPVAAMPGMGNPNRRNPMAGENNRQEEQAQFAAGADMLSDLREVYEWMNRGNTAIYALDPRGLPGFEFDINEGVGLRQDAQMLQSTQDTLRVLADETDGRAIVNRNDLETGMKQIVRDSSAYYLIGYTTQAAPDGKFHALKVRVKRPGVQVRSRKGFWAFTAEESARALAPPKAGPAPEVTKALGTIAEPARGRTIRTWVGWSKGENGKTHATVIWEPIPPPPGVSREAPARVAVMAVESSGAPVFRGKAPEGDGQPSGAADGAGAAGRGARVAFDAAPGKVQLRLSVEGGAGQSLDSDVREVIAPDFTRTDVLLATPFVYRARNALEFRALAADPDPLPTASREFRRSERLLIRTAAYGPAGTTPTVTARLLNRAGQQMSPMPVKPPNAAGLHEIDFPLSSLPEGEYLLEIKAKGAESEATELVAFRIVT